MFCIVVLFVAALGALKYEGNYRRLQADNVNNGYDANSHSIEKKAGGEDDPVVSAIHT
jgi:hypothetical protein